jgi:hypothetical protein
MASSPKADNGGANQHGGKKELRGFDYPEAPALASLGIDKNLAKAARIAWKMEDKEFEAHVSKIHHVAAALADSLKDAIAVARAAWKMG